ncbi:siphovirus ReqiPepy6 Gp37-like family protein [Clostridium botulinum]|uniref:siphovirus ReqiPepy6 Gp37-like family protein n=1 Tax=Clostridium botulinum TaxID=1491 RepID=UPI001C9AB9E5|nr:siphovirus ReqiPepy6 Gp37-like family protein [Clostridium botulinum]MBY6797071.1 siphovirus ReqiPepy6 Gp37-like family protein [Clostridium botulinum]MBY6866506.1 siphovirus ReqiPepy6 Gp37-like family protein [Clostridium botulinum]
MELYIFNRDLELKGILDTFTSLRWIRRYSKTGEFELHCALDSNTLGLLKRDNVVYKKDDVEAGYIETRQLKIGEDGQEYLEVKGKFLTNYLDRRISWDRVNFSGKTEELMRKLVNDNAINPVNINRKIPNLILGNLKGFTEDIKYPNSFGNILEQLENISNTNNLGYRNILDMKNRLIKFDVYKGVDRTLNNGTIAPCIFSRDFENILEQEYTDSLNNYRNTTLIAGAGEGKDRKITSIENGKGLDRYELYVDARDIQDTETVTVTVTDYDEEGNVTGSHEEDQEVEIPWERYRPLLIQRGKEKLEECQEVQTFDSKINILGNNKYKKDYDLGDIVTVVDKNWGIRIDTRITEIEEVYEEKGLEVNVVFGNNIPTIIDKIKQVVR